MIYWKNALTFSSCSKLKIFQILFMTNNKTLIICSRMLNNGSADGYTTFLQCVVYLYTKAAKPIVTIITIQRYFNAGSDSSVYACIRPRHTLFTN